MIDFQGLQCKGVLVAAMFAVAGIQAAFGADAPAVRDFSGAKLPFSFVYDGKPSGDVMAGWKKEARELPGGKHQFTWTDPKTGLKVTALVKTFADSPAVDWVVYFANTGTADTPIIENILPLDWSFTAAKGDCVTRHDKGSEATGDDFEPLEEYTGPGGTDHLESAGEESSNVNTLPFFNLQNGNGGVIGAIGWTGGWKADINYSPDGKTITMQAGMKRTHLVLHPGEKIRTPRIVLLDWSGGDWQASQNLWRRLVIAHYTPKENGKPEMGPILVAGGWGGEDIKAKLAYIDWIHKNAIPVNLFGIDAGWYGNSFGAENDPTNPWWKNRGDWYPSPRYYPNGLAPLGAACKAAGLGFICWLEPETSMPGRQIVTQHPDWFLHTDNPSDPAMVNYGNPAALKGITDMISGFITNYGITWYRQDFNIQPEGYWERADAPDRIGMTEIQHITGMYKLWDDLLAAHPGLHIDNCASGGRRIDFETMSRSFIIWRTDYGTNDTVASQAQTTVLEPWVPGTEGFEQTYTGSRPWNGPGPFDTAANDYRMRSGYEAGFALVPGAPGVTNAAWIAWVKKVLAEYKEVQPYFYADYYPLALYSRGGDSWVAWQFDRPEHADGLAVVLRRPKGKVPAMDLGLKGVNTSATYEVEIRHGFDKEPAKDMSGADLAKLQVPVPDAPGSALVFYRKK